MNFLELIKEKNILISTFNHSNPNTISDQVEFLYDSLKIHSNVRVENTLTPCDILILVEYFDDKTLSKINNYLAVNKRTLLYVVLTEHMDLIDNKFMIHGNTILTKSDYMGSRDKITRLFGLLSVSNFTSGFIKLLSFPRLHGFSEIIRNSKLYEINGPKLDSNYINCDKYIDFLFFGKVTKYRETILKELGKTYNIKIECGFIDNSLLLKYVNNSKFVLNIPQHEYWKWSSPMRVLKALKLGAPVLSISDKLDGKISDVIENISFNSEILHQFIKNILIKPESVYSEQINSFNRIIVGDSN